MANCGHQQFCCFFLIVGGQGWNGWLKHNFRFGSNFKLGTCDCLKKNATRGWVRTGDGARRNPTP